MAKNSSTSKKGAISQQSPRTYEHALQSKEAAQIAGLCLAAHTFTGKTPRERVTETLQILFEVDVVLQYKGLLELLYQAAEARVKVDGWPGEDLVADLREWTRIAKKKSSQQQMAKRHEELAATSGFKAVVHAGKVRLADVPKSFRSKFSRLEQRTLWERYRGMLLMQGYNLPAVMDEDSAGAMALTFSDFVGARWDEKVLENKKRGAEKARKKRWK